jgi:hypothetical protein
MILLEEHAGVRVVAQVVMVEGGRDAEVESESEANDRCSGCASSA